MSTPDQVKNPGQECLRYLEKTVSSCSNVTPNKSAKVDHWLVSSYVAAPMEMPCNAGIGHSV